MGMFGNVSKGPILQITDEIANHDSLRDNFVIALRNSGNYVDILKYFSEELKKLTGHSSLTVPQEDYLRKFWFDPGWQGDDSKCWWRDKQPIEPIIRCSLIAAIEKALEVPMGNRPKYIDNYWLCAGDSLEVIVTSSNVQVNRLILTPSVPVHFRPPSSLPQPVPIWVFQRLIFYTPQDVIISEGEGSVVRVPISS